MSDDKTKTGGADRQHINTSEAYELRDWAQKFGTTPGEVRKAVDAVGSNAKVVEAHLQAVKRSSHRPA